MCLSKSEQLCEAVALFVRHTSACCPTQTGESEEEEDEQDEGEEEAQAAAQPTKKARK